MPGHSEPFLKDLPEQVIVAIIVGAILAVFGWLYRRVIVNGFLRLKEMLSSTLKHRQSIKAAVSNQSELQPIILEKFKSAKIVKILVIRGLAVVGLKDSLFNQLLSKKSATDFEMQILMLDPSSQYAGIRAAEIKEGENAMRKGIAFSIHEIEQIKQNTKLNIVIQLYDELPIWRLMFLDETLFVSSYLSNEDGAKSPMHMLEKGDLSHFETYVRYFDYMWRHCSRPVRKEDYLEDAKIFSFDAGIALLTNYNCKHDLIWHCKTVARIARDIAENAQRDNPDLDVDLVEMGALLHDIGKSQSREIDHAYIGGNLVRTASNAITDPILREKLADIVERHTGAGLTIEDIRSLNQERNLHIPEKDYVPQTMEEKIVALADKLVEGDHDKTFEQQLEEKKLKFGPDSPVVRGIEEWHQELKQYLK